MHFFFLCPPVMTAFPTGNRPPGRMRNSASYSSQAKHVAFLCRAFIYLFIFPLSRVTGLIGGRGLIDWTST